MIPRVESLALFPMTDLVSLGEVMLRMSPPKYERIRDAASFVVRPCGAQFNMAADFAALGKRSVFLSKLPDNDLGILARSAGMRYGVDMSRVKTVGDSRIGVIYVEFGVAPRAGLHLYDRRGSAASTISPSDFEWQEILQGARLAHTDGIFPALGESCSEATLEFVRAAKAANVTVCFDMNYRETMWSSGQARDLYRKVLPFVDVLVTNRSVSEMVMQYRGSNDDLMRRYHDDLGCATVCLTSRHSLNLTSGSWESIALHEGRVRQGRRFDFEIVDRFGTGDAFFAGFLFGILERDITFALDLGNALCALAHTTEGDVIQTSAEEAMRLVAGESAVTLSR